MRRIIETSLIVLVIVMLFGCGGQKTTGPVEIGSLFPAAIGSWQRVQLVTGPEALEKINQLHGKNITVEAGAIGTYQAAGKRPAMIWISRSKTVDLTREQAEIMADKMVSNPRSPFHNPETMNINKIKVYKFLGMGQVHYIFCRERLAYWISAPPAKGEELLLKFL
ncbi:MAG: hypothetical protein U9P37_09120 [Pseudomonadota bacterium]|nr:hypothetical protein [Pseudomonadota bacterium]